MSAAATAALLVAGHVVVQLAKKREVAAEGIPALFRAFPIGLPLVLAVLSPRLYRQFGLPNNERIATEFGGVIIHSCGSIEHNLAELARKKSDDMLKRHYFSHTDPEGKKIGEIYAETGPGRGELLIGFPDRIRIDGGAHA